MAGAGAELALGRASRCPHRPWQSTVAGQQPGLPRCGKITLAGAVAVASAQHKPIELLQRDRTNYLGQISPAVTRSQCEESAPSGELMGGQWDSADAGGAL